ncbi:hypothetical protein [Burkholderia plantarii]|uniref:hypothetical protein n=1 Tax=Burkholderia plantarii TaxID=41899 RepID=UPI000A9BB492|nr:hypothetical protein [Burkholderia plantarii]
MRESTSQSIEAFAKRLTEESQYRQLDMPAPLIRAVSSHLNITCSAILQAVKTDSSISESTINEVDRLLNQIRAIANSLTSFRISLSDVR